MRAAQKAVEAIGRDRILGVVLNDAEVDEFSVAYRYYYHAVGDEARIAGVRKLFLGRLTFRTATLGADRARAHRARGGPGGGPSLRPRIGGGRTDRRQPAVAASLIAGVLQVALHYCDLYDLRTLSDRRDLVVGSDSGARRCLAGAGGAVLLDSAAHHRSRRLRHRLGVRRRAGRRLASGVRVVRPARRSGRALLIVGTGAAAVALAKELFDRRQELGVELVGFVDADPKLVGTSLINPGVIGTIDEIPSIVRDRKVDRVVVSLADARGKLPMDGLLSMKLNDGVQFDHLASVYEEYTGKIAVENLRPSWLIFSHGFRKSRILALAKRGLDVIAAALVGLADSRAGHAAWWRSPCALTSPGPALLQPAARRQGWARLHHPQVPLDARRRRGADRRGVVRRERSARDAARPLPPPHAARRSAAALERAHRRHEHRRSAAGAPGIRRGSDDQIPFYGQRQSFGQG